MGLREERLRSRFVWRAGGSFCLLQLPVGKSQVPPEVRWKEDRQWQEQQQGTCQVDVGKGLHPEVVKHRRRGSEGLGAAFLGVFRAQPGKTHVSLVKL